MLCCVLADNSKPFINLKGLYSKQRFLRSVSGMAIYWQIEACLYLSFWKLSIRVIYNIAFAKMLSQVFDFLLQIHYLSRST